MGTFLLGALPLAALGWGVWWAWGAYRDTVADAARAREAAAQRQLRDAAEPQTPADDFGTCPHCKTTGVHHINGTHLAGTTRTCVFCLKTWTIDHAKAPPRQARVKIDGVVQVIDLDEDDNMILPLADGRKVRLPQGNYTLTTDPGGQVKAVKTPPAPAHFLTGLFDQATRP